MPKKLITICVRSVIIFLTIEKAVATGNLIVISSYSLNKTAPVFILLHCIYFVNEAGK